MKLLRYLSKRSRRFIIVLGFGTIVILGFIDYATGPELSLSIFYLLPVALLAWYVGRESSVIGSVLGGICWLLADVLAGHAYSQPILPLWNALVRFGMFLIVAHIMCSLREAGERRQELRHFIVHDLRSPLGNVTTSLQILREEVDPNLRDLVQAGIASCNRMLTLINSILDLGRMERERMPLHLARVDTAEIVEASIEQIQVWASQTRVRLETVIEPGAAAVYADRTVAERILVNLLSNAVKHSPEESTVTIRVAPADAEMTAFEVSDQGAGVPDEWAEKIFDKYAQLEARASDVRTGSGLGLAFCRLAVEAHGGKIRLERADGRGTTVIFTLPSASSI